jgi:hypothetical protein
MSKEESKILDAKLLFSKANGTTWTKEEEIELFVEIIDAVESFGGTCHGSMVGTTNEKLLEEVES